MHKETNRERAESWTCGSNTRGLKKALYLSFSDSKLATKSKPANSKYDVQKNRLNESDLRNSMTSKCSGSAEHLKDSAYLFERPVYSSTSMESVELDDKVLNQEGKTFSKSNTISYSLRNGLVTNGDFHAEETKKNLSPLSPKEASEKMSFSAFLTWISPNKKKNNINGSITPPVNEQLPRKKTIQLFKGKMKYVEKESLHQSTASLDCLDTRLSKFKNKGFSVEASQPFNGIKRNNSHEPISTTALILENRPSNLPSKSREELRKHQIQYEKMVENAKKLEIKDMLKKKKHLKQQQKYEQMVSATSSLWTNEILPNWNTLQHTNRTRELWWQGLPSNVRGVVWQMAIGNELNMTKDLYDIMVSRAHSRLNNDCEVRSTSGGDSHPTTEDREPTLHLIRLDISRTFPQLGVFQQGAPYHDVVQDILGAYACYRPDVGYVQGMSFMAAMLLLNMEPADAFVTFANLLNKPCQVAFYRLDAQQMKIYFVTFEVFFERNLPKLFQRFKQQKLTPDMYLIDWVFTIFSKALDLDVASRVWDLFCRDGEEFLFRTAIAILKLHEDRLLSMDFIHSAQFLIKLPASFSCHQLFEEIADVVMISRRNRRWKEVFALLKTVR